MRFNLKGVVGKGAGKGRELGFATANIALPKEALVTSGIYAGEVKLEDDGRYRAALYVRPDSTILEAHLLDFDGDLYGKTIRISIGKKIRESRDFKDEKELKAAIRKDVAAVRKCLPE